MPSSRILYTCFHAALSYSTGRRHLYRHRRKRREGQGARPSPPQKKKSGKICSCTRRIRICDPPVAVTCERFCQPTAAAVDSFRFTVCYIMLYNIIGYAYDYLKIMTSCQNVTLVNPRTMPNFIPIRFEQWRWDGEKGGGHSPPAAISRGRHFEGRNMEF